ncbi:PKD domain-containing protein [Methanosarcina barkeri]|nr:PKD domain-containing protein [Methanosarcina barkeri]
MKKITLLAFLSIFLIIGLASPALAADITGERTLNTTSVKAGESFRVTLNVIVSGGTLYSLGIDENLPDGWTVTPVQNDGMIYDAENMQWGLIGEMNPGKKTVIYDVFMPVTTKTGIYSITGEVSAKEWTDGNEVERQNNITGDTDVTIEIMTSGGLANSAWPKFQRDLNNSGQSSYNGPQTNNSIWTYTATKQISSSPAIGTDGTIYIGSYDNKLYALNSDGTLKWSYTTGNRISSSPAIGVDGTVYIGSYDKNIYALNPDGTLKWSYTTGNRISCSPAIGTDGTVYIGSNDKYLYGLNPDGTLKWKYYAGAQLQCTPAIGTDGTIYIESGYRDVYALNPNGTLKWSYNGGEGVAGSPAIGADGTIYFGTTDNKKIYALNPEGTLRWSYTAGGNLGSSPAIGADGTIYIGSSDNKLYALNSDGTLKWTYAITGNQIGSPAIGADGTIYFGSNDNKLYALNPDGTLKWTYAVENQIVSSPAIGADGTLYIGSLDKKLYAFRDADFPTSNFMAMPTSGEVPLNVNFTDLSTNSPTSWAWDFDNDGVVDSTDQNSTYTFTAAGNYTVNLTVTNSVGSNSTVKTDYITVSKSSTPTEPAPVAAFTADVTSGTAPLLVNFTDQSTGSPTSWFWNFGDGTNATEQNPAHTYTSAGNYTVNLTVSNSEGSDSEVKTEFLLISLASPALAANITGERTLNNTNIKAGESFRVTLNVTVSGGTLYSLGIDENLPDSWTVTPVQNDGMTYEAANTQWGLIGEMNPGRKTVIYDVFVPATAETETYSITGEVSAKEWTDGEETERQNNITGDTDVTIGIPDIHIYPGDDFKSIIENAPVDSTIYWHSGEYGSDLRTTTVNILAPLNVIGDSQDSVILHNVRMEVNNFANNSLFENLQFTGSKGLGISSIVYNSEFLDVRNCLFKNAVGSLMVRDSTIIENCTVKDSQFNIYIINGEGGGFVKNNTFENDNYKYIMKINNVNNVTCVKNNYQNCKVTLSIFNFVGTNNKIDIYQNDFINCSSYAYYPGNDAGVSWSSPSELNYNYAGKEHISILGNYFDQYKGADADEDGVGDTSYTVGFGTDYAPLIAPIENYGNITVAASQLPAADFTSNVTSGSAPLSVNFTDLSTNSPTSWAWDFDNDGVVDSTDQNTTYTFTAAGNYTVNLTVTNSVGSDSTVKTDYITVSKSSTPTEPAPVADFTADVTSGTAPLSVQFTDLSENATEWNWDFGDGTNSAEQDPVHTFSEAGNYTVNLTVSNAEGNDSEVKTEYIIVSEPHSGTPVADFTATPTSGNAPLTVNFTDASIGNISSYSWDFNNDGTVDSTEQNPSYTYDKVGTYTVNLTVSNADGNDSEVKTEYIKVSSQSSAKPVAEFSASPTSGKTPLKVKFTDTSTGSPTSWFWNFGDGSKSFHQNPIHKYSKAGTYTVNLTVKNTKGKNTVTKTQYIKVITKPVANFSATPTSGKTPLKVKFTDTSTGIPAKWRWDFGDGSKSFLQNPVHKYSKAGTYTVNLTVKNAKGKNTVTKTQYIKVITKPVANFSATPTSGKIPLKVKFTDTSTGIPAKWRWDFGDGSKSFLQNPVHKYSKAGTYTVNLTVKNAKGKNTVTKTQYIKVITKPAANFTSSVTSGKTPLKVTFTDTSTGIPAKWRWDFGDGAKSFQQNPIHKYSKAGTYTVNLTVKNAKGKNTVTKTQYIKVV